MILGLPTFKQCIVVTWHDVDSFIWEILIESSVFHVEAFFATGIMETMLTENIVHISQSAGKRSEACSWDCVPKINRHLK